MVTVRTIKLKRSSQTYGESGGASNLAAPQAPEDSPTAEAAATSPSPESADVPAAAVAEPAPVTLKTVPGKATVWFMLVALIAVLGLLIILGLQYSEMSFYKLAPSVWLPGK